MIFCDEALKPCPFCGSDGIFEESLRYTNCLNEMWRVYSVLCSDESCIMHQSEKFYKTKESATKAWNRRAENK